jgi:serine/threonine protein kinase
MSVYSDFTSYGYEIISELGRNREGGRITWQAKNLSTQETVVIKQFCFATAGSSWSGYKAYEREIEVLQKLHHPGIPEYLDNLETTDGFCLIQKYIPASNLNNFRRLTVLEVKQIAIKLLDILIYLQQQNPPVLHRDIKPDNILVTESLDVYLIDFGLASLAAKEITFSSIFKGTPGFMAPEQINQPTLASDLYSLGVTLVCLLSDRHIDRVRDLMSEDEPYELPLKILLSDLETPFINWLKKMTAVKVSQRFPNAAAAKKALIETESSSDNSIIATNVSLPHSSLAGFRFTPSTKTIIGTVSLTGLSFITFWSLNFTYHQTELLSVDLAIALMATVVVGVAQLGAVAIASWDPQAQLQGGILGIIVPILVVITSGGIWGINEAVDICAAITIAEIVLFSYYWWQMPHLKVGIAKVCLWFSAIAAGMILGINLI